MGSNNAAAAAAAAAVEEEGHAPMRPQSSDEDDRTLAAEEGEETQRPLLQQAGAASPPAQAEPRGGTAAVPQGTGGAAASGASPARQSAFAAMASSNPPSPEGSVRKGGAFRAAVLAHKASIRESAQPERRSSAALPRNPSSSLHALHEEEDSSNEASNVNTWSAGDTSRSLGAGGRKVSWTALRPQRQPSEPDTPTAAVAGSARGGSGDDGSSAPESGASTPKASLSASRMWKNAALLAKGKTDASRHGGVGSNDGTSGSGNASFRGSTSGNGVQDSVSSGNKFFEAARAAARDSGGDYSHTFTSVSKALKDASQRSTATHTIPKVNGEWKVVDDRGQKVKSQEVLDMPPFMIHPFNPYYRAFLMLTVFWAAFSGFMTPWVVAFQNVPGLCPYKDFPALFEYLAGLVFAIDITLSFFTAYYDQELLITDRRMIARKYLKFRFWVDILAWIPFDYAIIEAGWPPCYASNTTRYVSLLKLLRLLRMYRVLLFFRVLEHNLQVSLLTTTMVRNLVYIIYTAHWAGCGFYFIARQEQLTEGTWLGMYPDLLTAWPNTFDRYIFSLYWAVTTIATVGYGDFHAASMPEAIFCLIYMLFSIGFNAFIVGTTTLVVMKNDERTGHYRQRAANLKQYSKVNYIPERLQKSMQEHLRLHFNNEEASDEQVLNIYPSTIRRRILRHLYLEQLRKSYLFRDCKTRYMDALLSVARVELFMPGVEILAEGDHVGELMILVGGLVELVRPVDVVLGSSGGGGGGGKDDDSVRGGSVAGSAASVHLGSRSILGDGEAIAEVAFFTEVVQMESVRSITVAKVLVIPRSHYQNVCNTYPIGARTTLENLGEHMEQLVEREFSGMGAKRLLQSLPPSLSFKWGSVEGGADTTFSARPNLAQDSMALTRAAFMESGLTPRQEQVVSGLLRVRTMVLQHIAKQDEEKTTDFLYAASKGDNTKVRQMLRQGFAVDSSDYDGRTALMLAAAKGHADVVVSLLAAGCDPQLADNLSGTAMHEACKAGHDSIVTILKEHGAELRMAHIDMASELCTLVFSGNLPLLKRYIQAGIEVDSADYDGRTPLHIAACEGHLSAVKLLIGEGLADVWVRDRWDKTPHDEAVRVGARHVAKVLKAAMDERPDPAAGQPRGGD